jgi:LmbE family N-acetylglucosaminyl deacetylase
VTGGPGGTVPRPEPPQAGSGSAAGPPGGVGGPGGTVPRPEPPPAGVHDAAGPPGQSIRLVGVFAHPDDDSYLIGGTLLLQRGWVEPTLVFATSGGAGPIASPSLATRQTLASVREGEQRAFLEAIGYPDARVHFLRHPDYHLPKVPFEQLAGEVEAVLREVRPQVVVSFGPDGMTSHHDHIRAGEAAAAAFRRARAAEGEPADAFLRLYQAAYPRSEVDRFYAAVREGGFAYGEEGRLFDITGVPDERIAVRVDTRAVRDRKWAAILRHRTQLPEHERIPEPLRWMVLDAECFVRAFPPRQPGEAVLGDLFAGLDGGGA